MRKFIVIVVVALVLCGASFYVYKAGNVSKTYENNETKKVDNNMLSMMLETSAGSGEYQKTSASAWPTEGYIFNSSLSRCKNNSRLSWDSDKKQVLFEGNTKDDCYVYFDKTITLVDYVKAQYTGTQGENNLYLHDSSLTNGAGDNSYRYAGSSETTNNFVCFGYDSKDGSCPTDNLYRVIGLFDNHIKLIKWDYAKATLLGIDGNYVKMYDGSQISNGININEELGCYSIKTYYWKSSDLNLINLNTNFLNNIGNKWSSKINFHTWIVGGNSKIYNILVNETYQNEIVSPSTSETTYDAKVGLMYVSDIGYASASSLWNGYIGATSNKLLNWMHMGLYEWTITKLTSDGSYCTILDSGINSNNKDSYYTIRPTFYLNSNIAYISGKGTKTEPIIIN